MRIFRLIVLTSLALLVWRELSSAAANNKELGKFLQKQVHKTAEDKLQRNSAPPVASQDNAKVPPSGDFVGLVDIGAGRKMYLKCSGSGSPTVILESGYRNDADIWSTEFEPGMSPVFSQIAKFTRVCAYDRPGTFLDAGHLGRSTEFEPGMSPVFSQIAKFTRVCAFDRPGTFLDAGHLGRSTEFEPGMSPVFSQIAKFTRVCAYDR